MGLLTEESIKSVENALNDARVTLDHQNAIIAKAGRELDNTSGAKNDLIKDQENKLTEIENNKGNEEIKLFYDVWKDYVKQNNIVANVPYQFNTTENAMAYGHELYYEATIPFEILDDAAAKKAYLDKFYDTYDDGYTATRTKRDMDFKAAFDKEMAGREALGDVKKDIYDKRNKALITIGDDIDKQIDALPEGSIDELSRLTLLKAANKKSQNDLKDASDVIETMFTEQRATYDALAKATNEHVLAKSVYNLVVSKVTDYIKEGESNAMLKQFEEEKEARKEHVKETTKNKERIKVLLEDKNDTVGDKLNEMNSDSSIFVKDIKKELEFTPAAESKLERIQSALDGSDSLFTARQALDLASESIYSTKAIVEKIKKACYAGETSIDLLESEVSGTQILMLDKVGYKITHASISNPGRKLDDLVITIDWGFASES